MVGHYLPNKTKTCYSTFLHLFAKLNTLLVNFVLEWYYNYNDKKWTMLGTGDMPVFF
jgi:hypothetical protein